MTSVRDSPPPMERAEPHELFGLLFGFMRAQAVSVAAKLGVADVIPAVGMDVAEVAARVGAHEQSLYRLLRYLSTAGVFEEVEPRRFAPTPLSDLLSSDAKPSVLWQAMMRTTGVTSAASPTSAAVTGRRSRRSCPATHTSTASSSTGRRSSPPWRALLAAERFEPHAIADGLIDARPA